MRRLPLSVPVLAAAAAIAAVVLPTSAHAHGSRIGFGVSVGVGHGWGPVGYGGFRPGWGHGGWGRYGPRAGVVIGAPLVFGAPYWSAPYYAPPVVVAPHGYYYPPVPVGPPVYVGPPAYTGPSAYVGPAPSAPSQGQGGAGAGAGALPPAGYAVFSCPNASLVARLAEAAGRGGLSTGGAGAILGMLLPGEAGSRMDVREQACIGQALELAAEGQRVSWGASFGTGQYSVVPGPFEARDGSTCRSFDAEISSDGGSRRAQGSACRRSDGLWVAQAG